MRTPRPSCRDLGGRRAITLQASHRHQGPVNPRGRVTFKVHRNLKFQPSLLKAHDVISSAEPQQTRKYGIRIVLGTRPQNFLW